MTDSEFLHSMHIEPHCQQCPLHEAHIVRLLDTVAAMDRRNGRLRMALDCAVWLMAAGVMGWLIWWVGRAE